MFVFRAFTPREDACTACELKIQLRRGKPHCHRDVLLFACPRKNRRMLYSTRAIKRSSGVTPKYNALLSRCLYHRAWPTHLCSMVFVFHAKASASNVEHIELKQITTAEKIEDKHTLSPRRVQRAHGLPLYVFCSSGNGHRRTKTYLPSRCYPLRHDPIALGLQNVLPYEGR